MLFKVTFKNNLHLRTFIKVAFQYICWHFFELFDCKNEKAGDREIDVVEMKFKMVIKQKTFDLGMAFECFNHVCGC
jgi:hypothetical protein